MKYQLLLISFIFIQTFSAAQSQSDIRERKIKSAKTITKDFRKGELKTRISVSVFDNHGNVIERTEFGEDSVNLGREVRKFNKRNDEIELSVFDSSGHLNSVTKSQYDKWHNLISIAKYDSKNTMLERTEIVYNNSNDKESEITTGPDGKISKSVKYEYDHKGMLISRKIFNEKGEVVFLREYEYQY